MHSPSRKLETRFQRRISLLSALAAGALVLGCGGNGNTSGSGSNPPPVTPAFTGQMHSGASPVEGAAVSFYAAGSSGTGAGATNLLTSQAVTTDASGNFSIPSFACPSSSAQVYLVGRGGRTSASGCGQFRAGDDGRSG